jgi:hypothetical protein
VKECLLCASAEVHPVRDLGHAERPRADEEEQTAEDSVLMLTAWSLQHLAKRAWHCVLRSALKAGTSTSSRPGMAVVMQ